MRGAVGVVWVLALLVPAGGLTRFDGIPLSTTIAVLAAVGVVLALASSRVRGTLRDWIGRAGAHVPTVLVALGLLVLIAKVLLVTLAPEPGFVACYTNPIYPRPHNACERSFDRPFDDGTTRIDEVIDFGPRPGSADRTTLLGSSWDLSFVNDTRLNVYPEPGAIDVQRLPFSASWTGTVDGGDGGWIHVTYVGAGRVRVGGRATALPSSSRQRTVVVSIGPGEQELDLQYRFADTVRIGSTRELGPYATVRVSDVSATRDAPSDGLLHTVPVGSGWQLLAGLVDLALLAFVLVCLAALAVNLARSRWLLITSLVVGVVAIVLSTGHAGFAALDLPIAPSVLALALLYGVLVWRRPDDLLLFGIPAAVVVSAERVLSVVPNLHSVVFRDRGSDWQTYQAFARAILEQRSLEGGESVFYYQPGFRYWAFAGHLGLGDGDALPAILGLSLLLTAVLLLTRWSFGRGLRSTGGLPLATRLVVVAGGVALLVAFTATPLLGLVVVGASEYPTWCIIPLLLPLLFTRPTWTRWIGGARSSVRPSCCARTRVSPRWRSSWSSPRCTTGPSCVAWRSRRRPSSLCSSCPSCTTSGTAGSSSCSPPGRAASRTSHRAACCTCSTMPQSDECCETSSPHSCTSPRAPTAMRCSGSRSWPSRCSGSRSSCGRSVGGGPCPVGRGSCSRGHSRSRCRRSPTTSSSTTRGTSSRCTWPARVRRSSWRCATSYRRRVRRMRSSRASRPRG